MVWASPRIKEQHAMCLKVLPGFGFFKNVYLAVLGMHVGKGMAV